MSSNIESSVTKRKWDFAEPTEKKVKFDTWHNIGINEDVFGIVCSFLEEQGLLNFRLCGTSFPPIVNLYLKKLTKLDLGNNSFKKESIIQTYVFSKLLLSNFKQEKKELAWCKDFFNRCPNFNHYFTCLKGEIQYDKIENVKYSDHIVLNLLLRINEHVRKPTSLTKINVIHQAAEALIAKVNSAKYIIRDSDLDQEIECGLYLLAAEQGDFEPLREWVKVHLAGAKILYEQGFRFPPILEAVFYDKCNIAGRPGIQPEQQDQLFIEAFQLCEQAEKGFGENVPPNLYFAAIQDASCFIYTCHINGQPERVERLQKIAIPCIKKAILFYDKELHRAGANLHFKNLSYLIQHLYRLALGMSGQEELRVKLYETALLCFDKAFKLDRDQALTDNFQIIADIFHGLIWLTVVEDMKIIADREIQFYDEICKNETTGTLISPEILDRIGERLTNISWLFKDNKERKAVLEKALGCCELAMQRYGTEFNEGVFNHIISIYSTLSIKSLREKEEQKNLVEKVILYFEKLIPVDGEDTKLTLFHELVGDSLDSLSNELDNIELMRMLKVKAIEHYESGIQKVNGVDCFPFGLGETCLSLSNLVDTVEGKRQLLIKAINSSKHRFQSDLKGYHQQVLGDAFSRLSTLVVDKAEKKKHLEESIKHYTNASARGSENDTILIGSMNFVYSQLIKLADDSEEKKKRIAEAIQSYQRLIEIYEAEKDKFSLEEVYDYASSAYCDLADFEDDKVAKAALTKKGLEYADLAVKALK